MTAPPESYACLLLREFPLQALLRLRPELRPSPCVVLEGEPPMQQVCSLNTKARALGLQHGMTRVEVDTFPSIPALPRSLAEEETAKAAVLECAANFSPRIETQTNSNTFLCILDIAGTETLLGPPIQLSKNLLLRLKRLGLHASLAVSSNFHTAVSMARGIAPTTHVTVIPNGEEAPALSPLTLDVLDLSAAHAEIFSLWGIRTLGALAALPEKALIARLGQEGKRILQLARGERPHLFRPIEPDFALIERMQLDSPVELLDSLLFVIGMMLDQMILRAIDRIVALSSVTIELTLEGTSLETPSSEAVASYRRTVKPAQPTNDKQLWIKLLHLDLEAHPPQAPILALSLCAEHGTSSKVQLGLFSPQLPETSRLDVTLARIRAIVGEGHIGYAQLKDIHPKPDTDGFSIEPFSVPAIAPKSSSKPVRTPVQHTSVRQIRPAELVSLTLHNQRPERFCFRDTWYRVQDAYGPWLSSGDWWNPTLWSCQQWDLIARSEQGALLCCCLILDLAQNAWRIVALYD
jgi:protein ImuB